MPGKRGPHRRAVTWAAGAVALASGLSGCNLLPGHGGNSTTTTVTAAAARTTIVLSPPTGQVSPTSAPTPPATLANGAPAQLVGDWLGPWPGPAGKCSYEYVEWFIYAAGSYTSTWNSAPLETVAPPPPGTTTTRPQYQNGCEGGVTSFGTWTVRGDLLTFHQQGNNCPECVQQMDIPVTFSFVGGDLRICDPKSGGCWDYARQRGSARHAG